MSTCQKTKKTAIWDEDPTYSRKDIMRTTTQIMLADGWKVHRKSCLTEQKMLNFNSYDMNDSRYGAQAFHAITEPKLSTTYMSDFVSNNTCKPLKPKGDSPHHLLNRLPKNIFETDAGLVNKFLDDHFLPEYMSENRRTSNFLRQIRKQSFFRY